MREATRTEANDSAATETRRVTALLVPKSKVSLTPNVNNLLNLPAGASYHARSGRASLNVKRDTEPGTIVVHASCGNLQRLVERYKRLARKYKETLDR